MHLFNKENIWSNPQQFPASCIHPDKHNNSVDRIISKEEEREGPRRDSSIYLRVQWCFPHFYKNYKISSNTVYSTVFPHAIQQLQVILHTELILLQELQGSSRAGSFQQLFPVSPSILHGRIRLPDLPTAFQGHTEQAGFQLILPGRNSILSGRQHPRSPYSSSQAKFYITEFYQEK